MKDGQHATKTMKRALRCGLVLAVGLCLVLGGTSVYAQTKNAKAAESLAKSGENAKKSISDVVEHVDKMLKGYNAIIDGSAKNTQSAYKKLSSDLKSTEKMVQGAGKELNSLNKEAEKFFSAWEKDLKSFSNDDLKQKSQTRLDASKAKYAALGDALGQASDAFTPLVQNLNDQILYLGRDLSPEAIADLADEAETLNQQAKDVSDQVEQLMQSAAAAEASEE
jgi:prefoldin subunit 5